MSIEKIKKLRELTGAGMMDVKKALDSSKQDIDLAINWLRENGISKAAKKADRIAADGIISIIKNSKSVLILEVNSETDFVSSNERFLEAVDLISKKILASDVESVEEALKLKVKKDLTVNDLLIDLISVIGEKISLRRFRKFDLKNLNVGIYKHSNSKIGTLILAENVDEKILKDISMHITAMSPKFISSNDIPKEKMDDETKLVSKEMAEILSKKPDKIKEGIIAGKVKKILSDITLLEQQFVKDSSKKIKDLLKKGKIVKFIRFEVGEGIEKKEENFAEEVAKQMKK